VLVPIDPVDLLAGVRVTTASRASAGYLVAAGDVARFAGHHALMVETVLEVHPPGRPGFRLDHLVGLVDPGTKAEPHAEGLLLRGTGSSVARMVALLRTASGD